MFCLQRRCISVMESATSEMKSCGEVTSHSYTRWSVPQLLTVTTHASHVPSCRGGGPVIGSQKTLRSGRPDLKPASRKNRQPPSASSTSSGGGAVEESVDLPILLGAWIRTERVASSAIGIGGGAVDTHTLLAATLVDLPLERQLAEGPYLVHLLVALEALAASLARATPAADEAVHHQVGVLATPQEVDDLLPRGADLVHVPLP